MPTQQKRRLVHRGLQYRRNKYPSNYRERVFSEEWEKECAAVRGTNYGQGILQDLMLVPNNHAPDRFKGLWPTFDVFGWWGVRWAFVINQRDATIAATVVQWLGTNCGFCFLEKVLRRCGYRLVRDKCATRSYAEMTGWLQPSCSSKQSA